MFLTFFKLNAKHEILAELKKCNALEKKRVPISVYEFFKGKYSEEQIDRIFCKAIHL